MVQCQGAISLRSDQDQSSATRLDLPQASGKCRLIDACCPTWCTGIRPNIGTDGSARSVRSSFVLAKPSQPLLRLVTPFTPLGDEPAAPAHLPQAPGPKFSTCSTHSRSHEHVHTMALDHATIRFQANVIGWIAFSVWTTEPQKEIFDNSTFHATRVDVAHGIAVMRLTRSWAHDAGAHPLAAPS